MQNSTTTPVAITITIATTSTTSPLTTTTSAVAITTTTPEDVFDKNLEEDYKFIVENLCYGNSLERLSKHKFSNYGDVLVQAAINIAEFEAFDWSVNYPFTLENLDVQNRKVSKKEMEDVENLLKTMPNHKYAVCILGYLYDKIDRYQESLEYVLKSLEMGCIETLPYLTEMLLENAITFNPKNKMKAYVSQTHLLKVLSNLSNDKLQIIIDYSRKYSGYVCVSTLISVIMEKNKQISYLQNLVNNRR